MSLSFDSGASSDMIMTRLPNLGADPDVVRTAVESMGCSLEISRDEKHHIMATRDRVQVKYSNRGSPTIAPPRGKSHRLKHQIFQQDFDAYADQDQAANDPDPILEEADEAVSDEDPEK